MGARHCQWLVLQYLNENSWAFLLRANRFLREHIAQGISVVNPWHVVRTQSYVIFLRMPKLASMLLFEYLHVRKLTTIAAADHVSPFH